MLAGVHLAATELVLAAQPGWTGTVVLGQPSTVLGQSTTGGNGTGAEFGKSAPIGLVVILLLLVALILLIRSMNRHVKKMPESFDEPVPGAATTSGPIERTGQQDGTRPGG